MIDSITDQNKPRENYLTDDEIKLGLLAELIGFQLRRASVMVGADFSRMMAGTGMRQVLIGILSIVKENKGVNQSVIARTLGIQPANVVRLMNELVDRKWLLRAVSTEDRRASSFKLTKEGKAALSSALARSQEQEDRLFACLTAEEKACLVQLLKRKLNTV